MKKRYKIKAKFFLFTKKSMFRFLKYPTWKWSDIKILMKKIWSIVETHAFYCVFFLEIASLVSIPILLLLNSDSWTLFRAKARTGWDGALEGCSASPLSVPLNQCLRNSLCKGLPPSTCWICRGVSGAGGGQVKITAVFQKVHSEIEPYL